MGDRKRKEAPPTIRGPLSRPNNNKKYPFPLADSGMPLCQSCTFHMNALAYLGRALYLSLLTTRKLPSQFFAAFA